MELLVVMLLQLLLVKNDAGNEADSTGLLGQRNMN